MEKASEESFQGVFPLSFAMGEDSMLLTYFMVILFQVLCSMF